MKKKYKKLERKTEQYKKQQQGMGAKKDFGVVSDPVRPIPIPTNRFSNWESRNAFG